MLVEGNIYCSIANDSLIVSNPALWLLVSFHFFPFLPFLSVLLTRSTTGHVAPQLINLKTEDEKVKFLERWCFDDNALAFEHRRFFLHKPPPVALVDAMVKKITGKGWEGKHAYAKRYG
jgi:hypothetical protein